MMNIIRLIVKDTPGVLDAIVRLVRRKGLNIRTLVASEYKDGLSHIILSLQGKPDMKALSFELKDYPFVVHCEAPDISSCITQELVLLQLTQEEFEALPIGNKRILDAHESTIIAECTLDSLNAEPVLHTLNSRNIPYVRSGVVCASKGAKGVCDVC